MQSLSSELTSALLKRYSLKMKTGKWWFREFPINTQHAIIGFELKQALQLKKVLTTKIRLSRLIYSVFELSS